MVKTNATYSIDHEVKEKFHQMLGKGNTSDDLEEYMIFRIGEYEKLKNKVVPDQGATYNNSESANFNSNSKLKSVTVKQEKIVLDVLNMSKPELSVTIDNICDIKSLGLVQANAHVVETVAKTRMKKLKRKEENG